jgi:NAD(P)H-nitrite reductase large subunit
MRIAIIGAGHAGVEAAASARQAGADVVLFSDESVLPYFRPRLPSVAFGQMTPDAIAIHPLDWYAAKGIELRLDAAVAGLETATRTVLSKAGREVFDAVVLANGAVPRLPGLDGLQPGLPVFTLWNQADAAKLCAQAKPGRRLVVVGGGILGIEAALRACEAGLDCTVLERLPRLMPMQFGETGSAAIRTTLESLGIRIMTGDRLMAIQPRSGGVRLLRGDAEPVDADCVLFAIGAAPNAAMGRAAGLAVARGICVDEHLQTPSPRIFAAGDVAQLGDTVRCSVRSAAVQGRLAGANAAAAAAGAPLARHENQEYPVFFKSRELELYAIGRTVSDLLVEARLDDGTEPGRHRVVVKDGEAVVGVQMVGTREGFDDLAARMK